MPELRQNYFTKEWVIIATERAKRPEDLVIPSSRQGRCPHLWKLARFARATKTKPRQK